MGKSNIAKSTYNGGYIMDYKKKAFWIWLSSIPGIGSKRFNKILAEFSSPEDVWNASEMELNKYVLSIGKNAINNIIKYKQDKYLRDAENIMQRKDIQVLILTDREYPSLLKNIYAPPPVLYVRGKLPDSATNTVAIVGSRRASQYGRQIAERLGYELSQAGVTVISGLAYGIDAMAHRGALRAEGSTVGVLGCGVDIVYPQENLRYYNEMVVQGAVVSEFPMGTKPLAGNFPARNRIISGLSQGVLVVEARQRSGAMITVDFALEQGRDVYAIPGNIDQPCSYGTNALIKDGAKLVMRVEDILEELPGYEMPEKDKKVSMQLDFLETQVYNTLNSEKKHIDQIANTTGMQIGQLSSILTKLEIKGAIRRLPGKLFVRSIT